MLIIVRLSLLISDRETVKDNSNFMSHGSVLQMILPPCVCKRDRELETERERRLSSTQAQRLPVKQMKHGLWSQVQPHDSSNTDECEFEQCLYQLFSLFILSTLISRLPTHLFGVSTWVKILQLLIFPLIC